MARKGKLIVVEGIDGSGKDTQIDLLVDKLNKNGMNTVKRTNVTDGMIGSTIRDVLSSEDGYRDDMMLAHLFTAELHLVAIDIASLLNNGTNVICSRWFFSTLAYAGKTDYLYNNILQMGTHGDSKKIDKFLVEPSLVLYIDIIPEVAIMRIVDRGEYIDAYEQTDILYPIRERYEHTFNIFKHVYDIEVIDGTYSVSAVFEEVYRLAKRVLDGK